MSSIRSKTLLGTLLAGLVVAVVAVGLISSSAQARSHARPIRLSSTAFAAEVGSLVDGGTVYAGAVVDPAIGHGAIVLTAHGTTVLHVAFQGFYARGSVRGDGVIRLHQATDGQLLSGRLTVDGGTGRYAGAHGRLRVTGSVDASGQIVAVLHGVFEH